MSCELLDNRVVLEVSQRGTAFDCDWACAAGLVQTKEADQLGLLAIFSLQRKLATQQIIVRGHKDLHTSSGQSHEEVLDHDHELGVHVGLGFVPKEGPA